MRPILASLTWWFRRRLQLGLYGLWVPIDGDPSRHRRISRDEVGRLRQNGIHSITDLWGKVGADYDDSINAVANQVGIATPDLTAILTEQAVREADAAGIDWLSRHGPDLTVGFGGLVIVVLGILAVFQGASPWTATRPQVVVAAADGLPQYHLIVSGDVITQTTRLQPSAVLNPSDVVGRLTLDPLPPGSVMTTTSVSKICWSTDPQLLVGKSIDVLAIPVKSAVLASVRQNTCVSIVLAPHDATVASLADDVLASVLILDTRVSGDSGTLIFAAPLGEADRSNLRRLLGVADVYIANLPSN